jgi:hypothetical protein
MLPGSRCKFCRVKFTPEEKARGLKLHPDCIGPFAEAFASRQARRKAAKARQLEAQGKRELRARKEALKSIGQIEEECRKIVQAIARIRDRDQGCISCEKPASWDGQWHGSHYRAHGGCSSLQFHLWNINKACWICNKLYSGRVDQQKVGIVQRYGQERLDWLDAQPKSKKYSREYLARFKKVMGKRLRRMEKSVAA